MKSSKLLHDKQDYIESIKKLFPLGVYWSRQFDDPNSDLSLWVDAKASELYRFKSRFADIIKESTPRTAELRLDDWERVLLGVVYPHLPTELRRNLLLTRQLGCINPDVIKDIGKLYGVKVKRIYFPFRSAFFGHSRFASMMCSPASFSLLFLECEIENEALKQDFERTVEESLLANNIVKFFYGEGG